MSTANEVLRILRDRRSIRRYRPEQVSESDLEAILEGGLWAASGRNIQSTVLVVIQDPETLAFLSKRNAQIEGKDGIDPFYGAPTVIAVLADAGHYNWLRDGSLVMGNLMIAAAASGVGSCWINRAIEFFDMPDGAALVKKWGLPSNMRGVGFCTLGYTDDPVLQKGAPRKDGRIVRI